MANHLCTIVIRVGLPKDGDWIHGNMQELCLHSVQTGTGNHLASYPTSKFHFQINSALLLNSRILHGIL